MHSEDDEQLGIVHRNHQYYMINSVHLAVVGTSHSPKSSKEATRRSKVTTFAKFQETQRSSP